MKKLDSTTQVIKQTSKSLCTLKKFGKFYAVNPETRTVDSAPYSWERTEREWEKNLGNLTQPIPWIFDTSASPLFFHPKAQENRQEIHTNQPEMQEACNIFVGFEKAKNVKETLKMH